jgi:hypothetical protein
MTVVQAAFRLRISPRWLRDEAEAGRIPYLNCGGVRLVNLKAVRDALGKRAAQGESQTCNRSQVYGRECEAAHATVVHAQPA